MNADIKIQMREREIDPMGFLWKTRTLTLHNTDPILSLSDFTYMIFLIPHVSEFLGSNDLVFHPCMMPP